MSRFEIGHPDAKVQEYITTRQERFTRGFNNASVPELMAMFAEDVEFNDYGTQPVPPVQAHANPASYGRAESESYLP
jgi:hypothetical protein